jgi:hypothetical protein
MMGSWGFIPDSGLTGKAWIVVLEEKDEEEDKVRLKDRVEMLQNGSTADFTFKPDKKLKQATPYKAEVTVDLSPFFGIVKNEAVTVLRK